MAGGASAAPRPQHWPGPSTGQAPALARPQHWPGPIRHCPHRDPCHQWSAAARASRSSIAPHTTQNSPSMWCPSMVGGSPDDEQQMQQVSIIALLELCDRGCLQDALDMGWLLTERCRARAQPHLPAVVHTAAEITAGLAALHAADMVHGDLSSYNVMLSSQGATAMAGGRGFVAKVRCLAAAMQL
jgi:hypothetical protein